MFSGWQHQAETSGEEKWKPVPKIAVPEIAT